MASTSLLLVVGLTGGELADSDAAQAPSMQRGCFAPQPEGLTLVGVNEDCAEGTAPVVWQTASAVDGRMLVVSQNMSLYGIIGSTYGGAGNYAFMLPDLREAAPKGTVYTIRD